jgi:excisionase family DNA binding protein
MRLQVDRNASNVTEQTVTSRDAIGRTWSGQEKPALVTEHEVAARYHVTIHSVRRWRREGRITFLKIGKQVLFRPRDLDEFEADHEVAPETSPHGRHRHRARNCGKIVEPGTKES